VYNGGARHRANPSLIEAMAGQEAKGKSPAATKIMKKEAVTSTVGYGCVF